MPEPSLKTCTKCGESKPHDAYYKQADCRGGVRPECKACTLAAMKRDRAARVEEIRARDRERYKREAERRKAYARAYYHANREERRAVAKVYYLNNREQHAAWHAKRKARLKQVEHQPYTRREIYDRDGAQCRLCGIALPYGPNAFHLDHIVPISLGGPDIPANIQLACSRCNRSKHANLEGQLYFAC
jgi:5-methylcytosine-specific restriction endonuclease McrA